MSIIACYARLSAAQLDALVGDPQRLDKLASLSLDDLAGAEAIDVDRAWDPIAWLLSPLKRLEQEHSNSLMTIEMDDEESKLAARDKVTRLNAMPPDLPLIAIEGRSDHRVEALDLGMGPAALLPEQEVEALSHALASLGVDDLETRFDPETMDRTGLFPNYWVEEGRDLMDNYVLPNFRRLQNFYAAAAADGQIVLVWFS